MKYIFNKNSIILILLFSLLIMFGCEDEKSTEVVEEIDLDHIDVTLINSWDLYEMIIDTTGTRKFKKNEELNERGDFASLVEEYFLVIEKHKVNINGETIGSEPEDIESVHMIDNQLMTVNVEGDSVYHYDYYRNEDTGALWVREDDTESSYFALDPTVTDSLPDPNALPDTVMVPVNLDEYQLFFVHDGGPELSLAEPGNNTQIDELMPTFEWEDNNCEEYNFQLRTDENFDDEDEFVYDEILTNNSFTVPENLDNFTTFYWRVKADNSDWSDIWSFGVYDVVALAAPLNNNYVGKKPTLSWNAYEGALEYTLKIADDANFTENVVTIPTSNTEYIPSDYLEQDQRYFWKVLADNTQGFWSDIRVFTINKTVSLTSPGDEDTEVATPVEFSWNDLQNITNYTLEVYSYPDSSLLIDEELTTSSYTESGILNDNQEYYWRVNSDVATDWSSENRFKTNDIVLLDQPEDGIEDLGMIADFTWFEYEGATDYSIQIAEDDAFTNVVYDSTGITDLNNIPNVDFEPSTQYFWHVKHDDMNWSETRDFTTGELEGTFVSIVAPIDEQTGLPQEPTLQWSGIPIAEYYRVQLSADDTFDELILNSASSELSYSLNADDGEMLDINSTYYWRVRTDVTDWNETSQFSTKTGIPNNIAAVAQPETPHKIDVSWTCQSGAQTDYWIERSTDGGSNWDEIGSVSAANLYYSDLNKEENTTYDYRVRSENPMGFSEYSDIVTTTTGTFALSNEPELVDVTAGSFTMGGTDGDDDEQPVRNITLTHDFKISKFEITNAEYCELLNWALGKGKVKGMLLSSFEYSDDAVDYETILQIPEESDLQIEFDDFNKIFTVIAGQEDYPITGVTWYGAAIYTNWLGILKSDTPLYNSSWSCDVYSQIGYRLPTEAEWEFAALGGNSPNNYTYSGSNTVEDVAWYIANATGAQTVGGKTANELNTYDMSGNLAEWCNDNYGAYDESQTTDPEGPVSGTRNVVRGGSWEYEAYYLRNKNRSECKPDLSYGKTNVNIGFRIIKLVN